ncbi:MAG: YraN family protein [Alphaproteobacteria bacterium]|nr:YraN family protein [Alphaproteobacteria bacterium]
MDNYSDGLIAESKTIALLTEKGFEIIEQRYSSTRGTDAGEIDLIAAKQNLIIFIEVKKRATIAAAAESITEIQKQRVRKNAEAFLARHPKYAAFDCRLDAALFNDDFAYEYIENAF